VYVLVMLADWVQGPYLYRLYAHHGFLEEQIASLYIVGFSSSMLSGPFLGGLADRYGRKR
jgi:MFS family permease